MEIEQKGRLICLGSNLYQHTGTKHFFHRTVINGGRTYRKLPSQTEREARKDLAALETDQARSKLGLVADPYAPLPPTVLELAEEYIKSGCPVKNVARVNASLDLALRRLGKAVEFFGNRKASDLKLGHCRDYAAWRRANMSVAGCDGGRTIDAELTALSACLTWAAQGTKIPSNPIGTKRETFEKKGEVLHCRDRAPATADELHAVAAQLFSQPRSEASGWQMLTEAFTGLRTSEALALRWDAQTTKEPGYIWRGALYVHRRKSGNNENVVIHPSLDELITALRKWHVARYPNSPWWFPSPIYPDKPLVRDALAANFRGRDCPWTSHSMRSFYVTVRRSMGISDAQIAFEIGDRTGAKIVEQVYGSVPANWSQGEPLSFLPKNGTPAWFILSLPENIIGLQVA